MKVPYHNRGFTLIELMTAVAVFLVVMTISMGSVVSIFDAKRKSESLKTVMDNLNFAVESMSKEMRFGKTYHCEVSAGATGSFTAPQNCIAGGRLISFISSENDQIIYKFLGTSLRKSTDGGTIYSAVTAPEITIQSLDFFVTGANPTTDGDFLQPKVLIKIKGYAGTKSNTRTDFTLQTTVSQRFIDI